MRALSASLRSLGLLIAGLTTATVAFEIYLRAVEAVPALWRVLPAAEVALYGPDPVMGYALRSGVEGIWVRENRTYVRVSSQGLRDVETSFEKPPGTFRIALAGDSITEALQVDLPDTFAAQLEQAEDARGRRVEVVNLGMSGAVPTVQVARMDHLGTRFSPDLLLYVVNVTDFLSSALADDREYPGYVAESDGTYRLGHSFRESAEYRFRTGSTGRMYYWLLDHVRLARVLNARRNAGLLLQDTAARAVPTAPACDPPRIEALADAFRGNAHRATAEEGSFRNQLRTQGIIAAFIRDVANTSLTSRAPAVIGLRGLVSRCPDEDRARQALAEAARTQLEAHGIALIDLDREIDSALTQDGGGRGLRDLYGFGAALGDGHLNAFGHRVFARALEHGLAPWLRAGKGARGSTIEGR